MQGFTLGQEEKFALELLDSLIKDVNDIQTVGLVQVQNSWYRVKVSTALGSYETPSMSLRECVNVLFSLLNKGA